jgi:hypothetical protein
MMTTKIRKIKTKMTIKVRIIINILKGDSDNDDNNGMKIPIPKFLY